LRCYTIDSIITQLMQNLYQTLGVNRDATPDEIKRAYRKLASQHHPDRGGDTQKFQEIQVAYDTLGDAQKRAAYDNPGFGGGFRADAPFDFQTIFDVFGTRFQQPGPAQQQRRQQARMSLWITLRDVATGGKRTISVGTQQGTHAVEIEIPLGIDNGDTVQYSGIGPGGLDLVVTYRIHPDARFERHALNLHTEHSVDVWTLITGGTIVVKDVLGNALEISVPARTQPGIMVRLRGRGLAGRNTTPGDLLVKLQARIPEHIDPELLALIEKSRQ
jgi:DnaJ-class molecular chaperone